MKLRRDGSLHPATLFPPPRQIRVLCVRCGKDLNGILHQDTSAGPRCLTPCEPVPHQLPLDAEFKG